MESNPWPCQTKPRLQPRRRHPRSTNCTRSARLLIAIASDVPTPPADSACRRARTTVQIPSQVQKGRGIRTVEDLWRSNPDHPQIANLHKAVKYRHQQKQQEEERRKEDLMTGVGGALLLVGAVVLGGVFAKKR